MKNLILFGTLVLGFAIGFLIGHKGTAATTLPPESNLIKKDSPNFFRIKGVLKKTELDWVIKPTEDSTQSIKAFPWPTLSNKKYPNSGSSEIPYSVGKQSSWFGAMCETEEQHKELVGIFFGIWEAFGIDPPSVRIPFNGPGFYIIVE